MTTQYEWDRRFMRLAANEVAAWSKDPDEKVGAIVVSPDRRRVSWGYNGFPSNSPHDQHVHTMSKEDKNRLTIHAERNALDNAPFDIEGSTLYVTKPPCFECMKGALQRGIRRIVHGPLRTNSRWYADQMQANKLAWEHGLECSAVWLDQR